MKNKKIFVMIITLITIICTFTACSGAGGQTNEDPNPPTPPEQNEYTVTFETNGGSLVNAVTTSEIKTEPVTTKEGFTFDGWFEDALFESEKVTFPYSVTKNITLYAKWTEVISQKQTTLDDFEYTQEGGVTTLTKYLGTDTDIILPIETVALTDEVFTETPVKCVVLSDGVTTLSGGSFFYATDLEKIEVSKGNPLFTSIDGVLFNNDKTELVAFPFGKSLTLDENGYTIPDTVTILKKFAFAGYQNGKVVFPSSLTTLEGYAFYYSLLEKAILPESVTDIGDSCFHHNIQLTELYVPKGAENCKEPYGIVRECQSIEKITAPLNVLQRNYNCLVKELIITGAPTAYLSCSNYKNLEKVILPDGIEKLGFRCFANCEKLTTIYFPNSLTEIGERAFLNCKSLTTITIPSTIKTIGINAFDNSGLENITLNEGLEQILSDAFINTKITSIKIPESVTKCTVWDNMKTLNTIYCPAKWIGKLYKPGDSNKSINHIYVTSGTSVKIQSGNYSILSIHLPKSITETVNLSYQYSLCQVTNLGTGEVTLPDNFYGEYRTSESTPFKGKFEMDDKDMLVYKLPDKTLAVNYTGDKTKITEEDLQGYTHIMYAFHDNRNITSVVIPSNIKYLSYGAFGRCWGLIDVIIKGGVEHIAQWAFYNCIALQQVYICEGVKTIEAAPFSNCGVSGPQNLTIKCTVSTKPAGWDSNWYSVHPDHKATIIWNATL